MKTRLAPLVVALTFLSALIISDSKLVKGQPAPMGKRVALSSYGVVLRIPGPNSKDVTLRHEGYAVAYRIKNPTTGKEEDRLAYAFGARQISNLEPVKQDGTRTIARTQDGVLEIISEAEWDETLRQLKTWRSVKVTAATEVTILAIESHADAVLKANDIAKSAATVRVFQAALAAGPKIGRIEDDCECPPCSPGRPCLLASALPSGAYRASLNMMEAARRTPALIAGSVGTPTMTDMSKGNFVNVLSWVHGVNMPSGLRAPGDGLNYLAIFEIR